MGVQQVLLHPSEEVKAVLDYLCEQSGKLYNSGVYFARQKFFKTGKLLTGKFDLIYEETVGKTAIAQSMPSVPAQQTLMSVAEAFKSYRELRELFFKGELPFKPKPPGYLKGSKLFKVAYPNVGAGKPSLKGSEIRFPLGLTVKRWFGISDFLLPMPSNLDFDKVKEFTILPKNGAYYLECSYELTLQTASLDFSRALSIDLGTADNLAACVDTNGNSFLVDARHVKAMNQLWNKKVATYKENKPQGFWNPWLDRVTRKRNHQLRDGINKAAKLIVEHCIENGIGNLIVGWNEAFKTNAKMGRINNQKFVQMPLGKFKDRLEQLCKLHGIKFTETEEAYTSKSSYLDGDSLPQFGKKPDGWKASGKRTRRGLYRTSEGYIVNADLNGSANIMRKVSRNLGLDLSRLRRRTLTTAARVKLWHGASKPPLRSTSL
ncbi:RNA-guided endonuclease InsQ/TnpB family protein [Calothrix sp. CCY 0018]|uniref:RNA-guided endonuclease InsQ/TnpB family protein n=1 Tax=Calothrix sp. CCY 0018 TaxID=3103864 RepID=UPI0039C72868